jgi:3-hydroxymyristoyl/3-hydroxydecanoyl-(acyl carrier protein) dehydratase
MPSAKDEQIALLQQRDPFLMIDTVVEHSVGEFLVAIPRLPAYWAQHSSAYTPSLLLEAMGQTAELLWRHSGSTGKGYLTRVDRFELQSDNLTAGTGETIRAVAESRFGKLCKAAITCTRGENLLASVVMTHYFE